MEIHALMDFPRGNIGASRNGVIGETPYEYLSGNSLWGPNTAFQE
jgi:hypothetical protein